MLAKELISELKKCNNIFNYLIIKCDDINKEVIKFRIDYQYLIIDVKK